MRTRRRERRRRRVLRMEDISNGADYSPRKYRRLRKGRLNTARSMVAVGMVMCSVADGTPSSAASLDVLHDIRGEFNYIEDQKTEIKNYHVAIAEVQTARGALQEAKKIFKMHGWQKRMRLNHCVKPNKT